MEIIEQGKKIQLKVGKKYNVADEKSNNIAFWFEASESGLTKGTNWRWVVHSDLQWLGDMKVINGMPFMLDNYEFVITVESADDNGKEKMTYYLERTA